MNHLTSIELAKLRQHELRADAARVRLAARATRDRRHRLVDWRDRITRRWRHRRTVTAPAATTRLARSGPFDELVAKFAAEGSQPSRDELTDFVALAAARGAMPTLLSILVDDDQPAVVRQRAISRVVRELTDPGLGSTRARSGKSDAA